MNHLPLSARLKAATQPNHVATERAAVIQSLLDGTLALGAYRALLVNLRPVYASLERGLQANAGVLGALVAALPALTRLSALDDDLAELDATLPGRDTPLPPAQAYARRIDAVAVDQPLLLAAHAYVRYLGDLSGGQILQRRAAALGAPTRFYRFGSADAVRALKQTVRDALDRLPLDADGSAALVNEANAAFAHHLAIFDALGARPATPATGRA